MMRIYLTLTYFRDNIVLKFRIFKLARMHMEKIGIIKEIDNLGRIVIPKDIRERYSLTDEVEIVTTSEGVLLKSVEYVLTRRDGK